MSWFKVLASSHESVPNCVKSAAQLHKFSQNAAAGQDPSIPLSCLSTTPFSAVVVGVKKEDDVSAVVLHNFFASPLASLGVDDSTKFFAFSGARTDRATKVVEVQRSVLT